MQRLSGFMLHLCRIGQGVRAVPPPIPRYDPVGLIRSPMTAAPQ